MDDSELDKYVANVLLTLRADNEVSIAEEVVLARVRVFRWVDDGNIERAEALLEESREPRLLQSRWNNLECLEDMVSGAYADGAVHASENQIVKSYTAMIGDVTEDQFSALCRRGRERGERAREKAELLRDEEDAAGAGS
ncbi:MAG: hypothetical protein ACOCYV_03015 [Planctomycetota bacterium]